MIYIFSALYKEAEAVIQAFQLKKVCQNNKFQEFVNEDKGICLVITGAGSISCAVAVSSVCTKYGVKQEDFLINIGTCASSQNMGEIFLCNKILDDYTDRTFYPDVLFKHDFKEAQVVTCGKVISQGLSKQKEETLVYDMEAAAIYQAGGYFFAPHRMSFLKVVSDHGEGMSVTAQHMERIMDEASPEVIKYIQKICEIAINEEARGKDFSDELKEMIQKVCEDLHCSKSMELSLEQHFRYLMLTGVEVQKEITKWYEEKKVPCKDRREGKKRFEELKRGLF